MKTIQVIAKIIQVIANIAIMAMLIEAIKVEYNSPDFDALDHVTLCFVSDGLEVLDTNRVED